MGDSYTRQETYTDGDVITAAHTNNEFDQILAAFAASTGHTHDGTEGEGGPISALAVNTVTIGAGTTGQDVIVTFDGETTDGVLKWMEDEDYFEFSDDILMTTTEKLQFRDTGIYIHSSTDGQLDVIADGTVLIDTAGDITLDADGGDIFFKDAGTTFGSATNTSGNLIIKSGPTTALTFSGANATFAGTIASGAIDTAAANITSGGVIKIDVDSDADDLTGDSATGRLTIGAGEDLNLYHGGTNSYIVNDTGDLILDTADDIILDADGGDVFLKDAGTTFGSLTNSSGNLIIKSGTTTALTFSGANATLAGDLTISGDDLTMGTNTAGHLLIADGANFNPTAVGDLSEISTVANDDVFIAVDTSGGGLKKIARSAIVAGLAVSGAALANVVDDTTPQLGGDLDMNGADIVTTSNADIDLAPNGTGHVTIKGNTNPGTIQFNCENNSHGQKIIAAPHSEDAANTLRIPSHGTDVTTTSDIVSTTITQTLTNKTLTSPVLNTATVGTSIVPSSADGATLGSASAEFSDLFLADGATIQFGNDQEITLTHVADDGLILKHVGTGDGKEPSFSFHAGDNDIAADDVLGSIFFKAPDEGAGTDAILVAAGIEAVSEGDFSASNNATKLSFLTGASEAAAEKMSLSSAGLLTVADDIVIKSSGTIGGANDTDLLTLGNGALTVNGTIGSGAISTSGRIITTDSTEATTNNDGALVSTGGLSVIKDAVIGNDLKLLSDSAVLSLGAGSDATLTHDGTTGVTIAANPITIDSGDALNLDAHTGIFVFKDAGSEVLRFTEGNSGDVTIKLATNGKDLVFTDHGDATNMKILDAAAGINVPGEVQTTKIAFTDGDDAITIADGGGITLAAGLDCGENDITNVGSIALDSISSDAGNGTAIVFNQGNVPNTNTNTSVSGSTAPDFSQYTNFIWTLTGDLVLTDPGDEVAGQSGIFVFIQDGTGSRTLSHADDRYFVAGATSITLSTAASSIDIVPYFVQADGKIHLGAAQLAFAEA